MKVTPEVYTSRPHGDASAAFPVDTSRVVDALPVVTVREGREATHTQTGPQAPPSQTGERGE